MIAAGSVLTNQQRSSVYSSNNDTVWNMPSQATERHSQRQDFGLNNSGISVDLSDKRSETDKTAGQAQ